MTSLRKAWWYFSNVYFQDWPWTRAVWSWLLSLTIDTDATEDLT